LADSPTVQFLGAAGTVTGSKHLVTVAGRRVLLDCGIFQGVKQLRLRNWDAFPYPASDIHAIVLSHAHIDHTGYLPVLVRQGYRGPIFCTSATAELVRVLLRDAAHLQEEEAEWANRHGTSKHKPALPLFGTEDVERTLELLEEKDFKEEFAPIEGTRVSYRTAGHILGSASVALDIAQPRLRLIFSGDVGRWNRPILPDPALWDEADIVLLESTYGNRIHPADAPNELARIVNDTVSRGGALLVPAFAVGRAQELIWNLRRLEEANKIPRIPVYLDSPMAIDASEIYSRHPEDLDLDARRLKKRDDGDLRTSSIHYSRTAEQSKALNNWHEPLAIIAGSGMATGGRILHHLKLRLPDPKTTVLLAGFQAPGTRGRSLQDGAKSIRIHGQDIPVGAKVEVMSGFSSHGDRDELLKWLSGFQRPPRQIYLVHGEPEAASALASAIQERYHWNVRPAKDQEIVALA
jgi:metallo-beta-lactamase family protein